MDKKQAINKLKAGASYYACGAYLARMEELHRLALYNTLGFERLERKNGDIREFFNDCSQNWAQTFYLMLLRTMGGIENKVPFTILAQRVPYAIILRERLTPHNIEALLIGASGLLELYPHDEYILNLKRDFVYLAKKYNIEPMVSSQWRLTKLYPNNHPILRLSQITTLLAETPHIMDRILECRTSDDANALFSISTQPYWMTHYTPAKESKSVAKRMGRTKTDLLAINLVVQMQFAYSDYTNSEMLRQRALALLEEIPAENNSVITQWNSYGKIARTAYDTQALLQLAFEYCHHHRCEECPVGRRIIQQWEQKQLSPTE